MEASQVDAVNTGKGQSDIAVEYREYFGENDFVSLDVIYKSGLKIVLVFEGFDDMERAALQNPNIPVSVWETLTIMQSEFNAAQAI